MWLSNNKVNSYYYTKWTKKKKNSSALGAYITGLTLIQDFEDGFFEKEINKWALREEGTLEERGLTEITSWGRA